MTYKNRSNESSGRLHNKAKINLARRRLLQAGGAAIGAGLFGLGAAEMSSADEFHVKFANRRVQEAKKVWEKGFRGQPLRTIGILSDGLEARHPDIGPWNGIRAIPDGDEGLKLIHENLERLEVPDDIRFFVESRSIPSNAGGRHEYPFTGPQDVHRVEAHMKSSPPVTSNGLLLLLETSDGEVISKHGGNAAPHTAVAGYIDPGKDYILAIENTKRSVEGSYKLEAQYFADNPDGQTDPFADVNPGHIKPNTPKVLGWYNEDFSISSSHAKPRSGPHEGGQGEFLASIMGGSGRGCTVDETTVTKKKPQETLLPGDQLTYEIDANPGRGVYGVVLGSNVEVVIMGPDGNRLDDHGSWYVYDGTTNDTSYIAETPTVHNTGTKTYKVNILPRKSESADNTLGPARVTQVSVGAFKAPSSTAGARTDEDDHLSIHAGIAPNTSFIGLSGYLKTRRNLKHLADDFARLFNLRVLTISLGFAKSPGIIGGELSGGSVKAIKALAEAGILTVSRSPNTQPPAQLDRSAAGADEAISVAQAGPWDGITIHDTNEPAALDEDNNGIYKKPDVTALGAQYPPFDYVKGVDGADGFRAENEQPPIRDYSWWGFVSAQPPFVAGTAGLVAQALEEKAPAGIALPPPEDSGFEDTMRLKQTILATASETPFTAAPWHRREPTYDFGGHDPIEGWGRVNIDTAVEAAARNLTPQCAILPESNRGRQSHILEESNNQANDSGDTTTSVEETVGLNLPHDSRAVGGHIAGEPGIYKVTVDFSQYTGEDQAAVNTPPHLDVFIYNAEEPGPHGTPNIVTKGQVRGSASVQFKAGQSASNNTKGGTYYVVVKLVSIPGAYNSFDIQVQFDLSVEQIASLSD